jgi:hypothetical protein
MRTGQIAMETILIYGVSLLVVGLAIGGLIYFGVLDMGSLLPNKCEMAGVKLTCEAYSITATSTGGQLLIEMTNRIGKKINIKSASILGEEDFGDVTEEVYISTDSGGTWAKTDVSVANGQTFLIASNHEDTATTSWTQNLQNSAGSRAKGRIQIKYVVGTSSVNQIETGEILSEITSVAASDFFDVEP